VFHDNLAEGAGWIQRHHEVGYYLRKAQEKHGIERPIRIPDALPELLEYCRCSDLLDVDTIPASLQRFELNEADLRGICDEWIGLSRRFPLISKILRIESWVSLVSSIYELPDLSDYSSIQARKHNVF